MRLELTRDSLLVYLTPPEAPKLSGRITLIYILCHSYDFV